MIRKAKEHPLAIRRKELGLSRDQLVERVNGQVSRETIGRIERGERTPRSDTIGLLAEALDCEPDYLLGRISDPNRAVSNIAEMIPLSSNAIKGLIALKDCIDTNRGFYMFDGIVDDEIDARLITGVIDFLIQELCDSESSLLQALQDMEIAYDYESDHILSDGKLVGDFRSIDVARMSKNNSRAEVGRLMGLCVQDFLDQYFKDKSKTEEA